MTLWMKRVLVIAALASGGLMISSGSAEASLGDFLTETVDEVISQTQEATNTNNTEQDAAANAETNQVNVYAPVAILSSGSNNGNVEQSNEAVTIAEADNDNKTEQSTDQEQSVDSGDRCGKCGGGGDDVSQSQTAANDNNTEQDAAANAETNQVNVYAPVAILGSGSNNGNVDQSNEAVTIAEADNDNKTEQSVGQEQSVDSGDRCGKCGGGSDVSQSQTAVNDNETKQDAGSNAETNQENVYAPRTKSHGAKDSHEKAPDWKRHYAQSNPEGSDVDQSNEAVTIAEAENDNATLQVIDQKQTATNPKPSGWIGYGGHCGKCERPIDQNQQATNSNVTDQSAGANATTDQSNRIGEESGEQSGKHPCLWDWNVGYADLDQSNSALTVADAGNENWTGQMVGQVQQVNAGR